MLKKVVAVTGKNETVLIAARMIELKDDSVKVEFIAGNIEIVSVARVTSAPRWLRDEWLQLKEQD